MDFAGPGKPISEDGFKASLDRLGVEAAALWAVLRVETSGVGFLPDRRPQILFERHIFAKQTGGQFNATAPDISNPSPGGYEATGAHQYDRLAKAIALDRRAALRSASWGIGQVMGFHAESLGYADVEAMVQAMVQAEDEHLRAMVAFVVNNGLHHALQRADWAGFAHGYNGADYAKNSYDTKLAQQYGDLRAHGIPDLRVRAAQLCLRYAGYDPGPVDGLIGARTQTALRTYQAKVQLPVTGIVDDATLTRLLS